MQERNLFESKDILFKEFENQFSVGFAESVTQKRIAYSMRHHVYRQDLGLEEPANNILAVDKYDAYSHHLLLLHRPSNVYAGSVRLITPRHVRQQLPIHGDIVQKNWGGQHSLNALRVGGYSEISTLAVATSFHRRTSDESLSKTLANIDEKLFAANDHRDFPKITMGLYLAAVALAKQFYHKHVFAVMPPMLFKKLSDYGLKFTRMSHAFTNQGAKGVYCLNIEKGVQIAGPIATLNDCITRQLANQLSLLPQVKEAN